MACKLKWIEFTQHNYSHKHTSGEGMYFEFSYSCNVVSVLHMEVRSLKWSGYYYLMRNAIEDLVKDTSVYPYTADWMFLKMFCKKNASGEITH